MQIPPKNALGQRMTVNRNLSQDERVWHFRSAWNVAALNCRDEVYRPILEGYRAYIVDNARTLRRLNDRVEEEYREREVSARDALLAREDHMTKVYNFFALPSARGDFCRVMLDISNRSLASPPEDPVDFALANFPLLEVPFDRFFMAYEGYQVAAAQWDERYGQYHGPSQPGWVAVQAARERDQTLPSVEDSDPSDTLVAPTEVAGTMIDPDTGAVVPVIPVIEGVVSQPLVQPIPIEPPETAGDASGLERESAGGAL
ncbi:hypothetical protein [Erythrobacter sp.]|uniref:hypothetical protein n=1 Tax=Erythrobacter sp. TaxID=1042 RepID=UPI002608744F|nr:hypothetical protein [Erythrobacter sp.]